MYHKAKDLALCNGLDQHVVAILYRKRKLIKIGSNTKKTCPEAYKVHSRGPYTARQHAEMNVLRYSQPGDSLVILRFLKNGELSMAQPCELCQKLIKTKQLSHVVYSDWNGVMCEFRTN